MDLLCGFVQGPGYAAPSSGIGSASPARHLRHAVRAGGVLEVRQLRAPGSGGTSHTSQGVYTVR